MKNIHHNFKLPAARVPPKLPKMTNLARALYCQAEIQLPDLSDQ